MDLLEKVKFKIAELNTCSAAYILAHAAWSACDHRELPGPSVLEVSHRLDKGNIDLVSQLQNITRCTDYSNTDQAEMLRWLHSSGYSKHVAKQVKKTMKTLVDWNS